MWKTDVYVVNKSDKKRINRWKRAIKFGKGDDYDFLMDVINDAKQKESCESYSKYYQCAKFIRDYNTGNYKYTKKDIFDITCCKAYPDICGGVCCRWGMLSVECQCDIIPEKYKKLDNCYDDCCAIYLIKTNHRFTIRWL